MSMSSQRKIFLFAIFFICLHSLLLFGESQSRPNIVWIFIDDQGPDWACYGNELVHTPNLDSLAADGVVYEKAFAVSPVCSPSHTSLFTGNYPSRLGCGHHRSHYIDSLPEGYKNIEEIFSENGYFTVNLISDGDSKARILHGASGKTDLNYNRDKSKAVAGQSGARIFDHIHKFDNEKVESYFSGGVWEMRKKDQPFFAYINIETGKAHGFGHGNKWAMEKGISAVGKVKELPLYLVDNKDMKRKMASIYDSVSYTDFVVGRFIESLKKNGFYKNSLIAVAGDHGYAVLRHKQTLYDSGLRVPMLIKYPASSVKGRERALASIIDIGPTSLAAAGIKSGAYMGGINLKEAIVRKEIYGARDGVDNFFDRSRTVRSERYRLIINNYPEIPYLNGNYAISRLFIKEMKDASEKGELNEVQKRFLAERKPAVELYDLENDPCEVNNLAALPEHQELLKSLSEKLLNWQKENNDLFVDYRVNGKEIKKNSKVSQFIPSEKK